jgi:UDPglucose 6-dehydrogenase
MDSSEAESVKLFANSYLATRISFFNELDSFSMTNEMDSKQIIDGICSDPRIGDGYNNPSFGFGGYCLPKDSKQLLANFDSIPNSIIKALNRSNQLRKKHIVDDLLKTKVKNIGIYLLAMKKGSDNFRESSIIDIIKLLKNKGKNIFIHEPLITDQSKVYGCTLINDFDLFINKVNLIVTNRASSKLKKVSKKVYTRDIYGEN